MREGIGVASPESQQLAAFYIDKVLDTIIHEGTKDGEETKAGREG